MQVFLGKNNVIPNAERDNSPQVTKAHRTWYKNRRVLEIKIIG